MDDKPSSSRWRSGPLAVAAGACRALWDQLQLIAMWCFAPRHTLDGGLVVCQGRLLAEGGFSYVYSGVIASSGQRVVLKQVRVEDPESRAQARREIEAHRRFDHPNLMPLLDATTTHTLAYLAFPLCTSSLRAMIDAKVLDGVVEPWTPRDFARLFEAVCKGVAAIRAEGYAHPDLKPDNLLDGRPVLTDFGRVALGPDWRRDALVLQEEAVVLTTMSYRAPELWAPETPADLDTAKANVLGLGCLL
mmetsp:Transcript_23164/g.72574  ORF Transcript_23164/g.72574 Transcript_23164/m.72574 type:complete len:247 (+) Transcript_23164:84-824(+)